jgi:hypothetical protein
LPSPSGAWPQQGIRVTQKLDWFSGAGQLLLANGSERPDSLVPVAEGISAIGPRCRRLLGRLATFPRCHEPPQTRQTEPDCQAVGSTTHSRIGYDPPPLRSSAPLRDRSEAFPPANLPRLSSTVANGSHGATSTLPGDGQSVHTDCCVVKACLEAIAVSRSLAAFLRAHAE